MLVANLFISLQPIELYEAPWYSLSWFDTATLQSFQWVSPVFLYAIAALPLLWIIRTLLERLWHKGQLKTSMDHPRVPLQPMILLRFLPTLTYSIGIACLLLAAARPQQNTEHIEQWSEGIDILLAIDISESMKIEDFRPTRLEASKRVAADFVAGRTHDRIGLVVFSGEAYAQLPLTTDYELIQEQITAIDFDMIDQPGTAIGSALAVATNRMRESKATSKVIILLSDGDNTAGPMDPLTAAKIAEAYHIKLYTIAIGRNGRVPFGRDAFGRTRYIENSLDERTLRRIADIGHGQFYRADDNQALKNVFKEIDTLEKSEIKETKYRHTQDFYHIYLRWGLICFALFFLLKATFVSNILAD